VPGPGRESRQWRAYLSDLARAPSAGERVPDSLELAWEFPVGRAPSGPLAVGDSVVIAATTDRKIAAVSRSTGQLVWRKRLNGPAASGPLFTEARAYIATGHRDGAVAAFEIEDGKERWRQTTGPVVGSLALSDSAVYAATLSGRVIALDLRDGEPLWVHDFRQPLRSGVTLVGPHLVVASDDSLFLIVRRTGGRAAAVATDGAVTRPPAVTGSLLITTSPDGFVTAFALPTLGRRWQRRLEDPVFGAPSVARDTIFVITAAGSLWRFPLHDPMRGTALELGVLVRAPVAPVRNGVLVGAVDGEILLIAAGRAEPMVVGKANGPFEEPPIVSRGTVYVIDGRGTIHAWAAPPELR